MSEDGKLCSMDAICSQEELQLVATPQLGAAPPEMARVGFRHYFILFLDPLV
jgi:hypothetical protein